MAPHEHVEPGRVAAAYLESIDGRERLLHGEVPAEHRRRRDASGQGDDLAGGPQPIVTDRPQCIFVVDQLSIGLLEFIGVEVAGVGVETLLGVPRDGIEPIEA